MRTRRGFSTAVVLALWALLATGSPTARAVEAEELLPPISEETLAEIDQYLEERLAEEGRPGLAAVIVHNGRVIHTVSKGEARLGVPMRVDTPVFLASVSKSITALTLMTLVEENLVEVNEPVTTYVPELGLSADEITVASVMYQHTGVSTYSGNHLWIAEDAGLESNLEYISAEFDSSAGFEYSNANYDLLALIVERAAGEPYGGVVKERVFQPLDMDNSFVGPQGKADVVAQGHYRWLGLGYQPQDDLASSAMGGSAAVYSSADDLAHMLIAHLDRGEFQGRSILSQSSVEMLHDPRPYEPEPFTDYPVEPGYAGGLRIDASFVPGEVADELAALVTLYHGGASIATNTLIWMIPEVDLGFVLLTNGNDLVNDGWIGQIAQNVKLILFGLEPFDVVQGPAFLLRWGKSLLLFVLLTQIGLAVITVVALRRNRRGLTLSRRDLVVIGLASLVDVFAAVAVLWLMPTVSDQPLRTNLAAPDLRIIVIALTLGVLWGIARTILLLRSKAVRRPGLESQS